MSNYNINLQSNNDDLQTILNTINTLPEATEGVELPELTNEGVSSDLLLGKELIDQDGSVITGTMPNNGSISSTMDGINTKSVSIPSGYTSGGIVSLDSTIDDEVNEQADLIAQIKSAVDNLPDAGTGGSGGYDEGFEAGQKSEYDRFWDTYQNNGNRTVYTYAFAGIGWNDESYNPKHPITSNAGSGNMFYLSNITDTKVDIDIGGTTNTHRFARAEKLVTIRKLIVKEAATYTSCFSSCTALENITIEGVIGKAFDISDSTKLTHDSLMSIINHLKDRSSASSTLTLTIGSENLAKLTDEELAIAQNKGWTVS